MVNLLKRIYHYDEMLSKETKDNILKHKRRVQYFFIIIPSMLILLGYLANSVKTDNYTSFKLFYLFLGNFVNNIIINIGPISVISTLVVVWLITMYKPNIVKMFWIILTILSSFYILLPDFDLYVIETMYQLYILFDLYREIIAGSLIIILSIGLMITKIRNTLIKWCMKGGNYMKKFMVISLIAVLSLTLIGCNKDNFKQALVEIPLGVYSHDFNEVSGFFSVYEAWKILK